MVKCSEIVRKIPKASVQKGIYKCKDNIADYLKDSLLISNTCRLYHAIISLEFALEEFGKILLLKEAFDNS
jgi:hypothetical protein